MIIKSKAYRSTIDYFADNGCEYRIALVCDDLLYWYDKSFETEKEAKRYLKNWKERFEKIAADIALNYLDIPSSSVYPVVKKMITFY